jgi:hypothetical protein
MFSVLVRACLETEVLVACEKAGIVVTAYSPLGSDESPLLKNDVVVRLAEKYKITPANVLVSFQVNTPNVNGKGGCQAPTICSSADSYLIYEKSFRSLSPASVSSVSPFPGVFRIITGPLISM